MIDNADNWQKRLREEIWQVSGEVVVTVGCQLSVSVRPTCKLRGDGTLRRVDSL